MNTVLPRDVNDIHLDTFLAWIKPRPLQLRFIELMETGDGCALFYKRYVSGELIRRRLEQRGWQCQPRGRADGPGLVFRHEDYHGEIGLIMPYAKNFCASCNRLRVSSLGKLHLCLFGDGDVPLRDLLESDATLEALKTRIAGGLQQKKQPIFCIRAIPALPATCLISAARSARRKCMSQLTHITERGEAHMVDVSAKADTVREARASAYVTMATATLAMILDIQHHKGDVFATARIAGIQAAKRTWELIPLCHPLLLSKVEVQLTAKTEQHRVRIDAVCRLTGKTGVEMEALTAASVAALTIYDMCKAVQKDMVIGPLRLLTKSGGESGDFTGDEA